MSTPTRSWRSLRPLVGPSVATLDDIPQLNEVFAEAFTDRYRKDGMVGVRVPPLSPAIWRYAIEDAGAGALLELPAQALAPAVMVPRAACSSS